ncbi:hypothetical protein RFI_31783 [Reticulomyxa filosa]|uniref:Uncharacterized protein n=1 Tax=Reticulomyxa filosa TaxID=46433 RepID=X6LW57_RETFI|nr:hypothetical protein RFI_31783 [Reticulomyxa filosa]|eukprot:ETO05611.1 hypothetical protein RFI_31783 [Reticulomyxa filosa]
MILNNPLTRAMFDWPFYQQQFQKQKDKMINNQEKKKSEEDEKYECLISGLSDEKEDKDKALGAITVKLCGKQFDNAFNYLISRLNCEEIYIYINNDKYACLLVRIVQRLDEE